MNQPIKDKALANGYDKADHIGTYGECCVTYNTAGPFVCAPFMVKPTAIGRRLVLHESIVRMMAGALELIEERVYNEDIDTRDAEIADLKAELAAKEQEASALRWAAEQYFAANPGTPTGERGVEAHDLVTKEKVPA
jgi:hypothetical protein